MKKIILLLSFIFVSFSNFAVASTIPTASEVQNALSKEDYVLAQTLLDKVIQEKPNNAPAHFFQSLVHSHNKDFSKALEELKIVEKLDPDIKFINKNNFNTYKQDLYKALEKENKMNSLTSNTTKDLQSSYKEAKVITTTSTTNQELNVKNDYTNADVLFLTTSTLLCFVFLALGLKKKADINNNIKEKQHNFEKNIV